MKRNEVIVYEHKKGVKAVKYNQKPQTTIEPPKPRNPVAKNAGAAIGGGAAGAHKDKKKAAKQGEVKHKSKALDMAEGYGRSNYYNPMDYERQQQRQMDWEKRDFKRREMEHELGHEDDPDFERNFRQQQMDRDRGPWYIKINGKILKVKGEPKVFDWKSGAIKYGQAIIKNKPELQSKIFLTKKNEDDQAEATGDVVGNVTSATPDGKVKIKTSTGSEIETSKDALIPGAAGTLQMKPDAAGDALKPGTKVVSTEGATDEEMMAPPSDSSSPIPGDNDHDEMSKLLVKRLRRLAGL